MSRLLHSVVSVLSIALSATMASGCWGSREITVGISGRDKLEDGSELVAVTTYAGGDSIGFGSTRLIENSLRFVGSGGDSLLLRVWYPAGVPVDTSKLVFLIPPYGNNTIALFPLALETTRRGLVTAMLSPRGPAGDGPNRNLSATYGIAEFEDARLAIDAYARRHSLSPSVGLFGSSLGGVIALSLAGSDPRVRGVAVEGVMTDLDAAAREVFTDDDYERMRALAATKGDLLARSSPLVAIPRIPPMPVYLIWGENDRLVEKGDRDAIIAAGTKREPASIVRQVPGGAHTMRYGFPLEASQALGLNNEIGGFLEEVLRGKK